jgi:hypothetical protein
MGQLYDIELVMDEMLIFGLFGHFHTEVNPEMIPRSQRAVESLKIESFYSKNIYFF